MLGSTPEVNADVSSTPLASRITNLDAIRGFAVLGILVMNAVAFGLPEAAYFNLAAGGSDSWTDWLVGAAGEIFIDHKMMALFSMLFGAGIVLFTDRASSKGRHPILLSLWRNVLLLGIGLLHSLLWDGDVLVVYAICAPFVIMLRNWRPRALFFAGAAAVLSSVIVALVAQTSIPPDGAGLGSFWLIGDATMSDTVALYLTYDFYIRALGMMLIGVALYRTGTLSGTRSAAFYRGMVRYGFVIGLPIAAVGVMVQAVNDFSVDIAMAAEVFNVIATIPVTLAYVGLITVWNQRRATGFHRRIWAVGRMALTNYLTQTIIGIAVFRWILGSPDLNRSAIALFVVAVWAVQLAWSKPWLDRFWYGPFEWAWRSATYRKLQPMRRATVPAAPSDGSDVHM